MRRSNFGIIIGMTLLQLLFVACKGEDSSLSEFDKLGEMVSDSVKTGNFTGVHRLLADRMLAARDSDEYYACLSQQSIADYYGSQPDSMLKHTQRVMRYASQYPDKPLMRKLLAKAYGTMGAYYVQFNFNSDSCIHYQSMALDASRGLNDRREELQAMGNLADSYRMSGRLDLSASLYLQAIALADSISAPRSDYIPLYGGLAGAYTSLNDFDNSRVWLAKEGGLWNEMSEYERFNYLNNSGNDYYLAKDYDKALATFRRLRSHLDSLPEAAWERHFCSTNLTDVFLSLSMPDSAEAGIAENLHFFSEVQPNLYAASHIKTQQMRLAALRGNRAEVERLLRENPISPDVRPEQRLLRLDFLRDYYARTGQWREAYDAESAYQALEDSVRSSQVKMRSEAMRLQYEHSSDMLALRLQIAEQERHHTILVGIVIAALLGVLLLIVVIRLLRQREQLREQRMMTRIRDLRIDNLRSRITPHFIYNALNHEIARRERGEEPSLKSLSDLLRRQQMIADDFVIHLQAELDFVSDFVEVKREGLGQPLEFSVNVAPDIDPRKVKVPSMMIQIFVENAFKHGFGSLPDGAERILAISIRRKEDNYIEICVDNNTLPGHTPTSDSTRQGLRIVDSTLQILNEHNRRQASFNLIPWTDNPQQAGCRAILTLPEDFKTP